MYTGPHTINDGLVFGYDTGYGVSDNNTATRHSKGEPTPFTPNTRSATESLLDLTGNSTIDVSNVSFDSNAQIGFSSSGDKFLLETQFDVSVSELSFEVIFKGIRTSDFGYIVHNNQINASTGPSFLTIGLLLYIPVGANVQSG